jgi:AcrR family transcriptional regulator
MGTYCGTMSLQDLGLFPRPRHKRGRLLPSLIRQRRTREWQLAQDPARAKLSDPVEARGTRTRGKQTIRRLLIAGREALREVGYANLRVDDVVTRAGTSHGTFYLYFSDKRDLLDALRDDLLLMVEDLGDILPVLDGKLETRRQLEVWVSTALRVLTPHAGTIKALMSADPNWDWREVTRSIEGSLGQRIRAANGVVDIAAEHVAWAISAMLVGLAVGAPTSPYAQTSVARMIHNCILHDAA